jgi:hypothetical protein
MIKDFGISRGSVQKFQTSVNGEANAFWGFRKMFWDYLNKLHVPFHDECCIAASEDDDDIVAPHVNLPMRYNDETDTMQFFNGTTWTDVSAGAFVQDSITLDDGLVSALALRIGADTNNGLYGVSDTQLGIAVEGTLVGGANTTGLFTGNIAEQVAAAGVTVDGVLLKDGGVSNAGATQIAGFYPTVAAQALSGPGAVNVTSYLTKYTSTAGAEALTLAAGTQIGQRKRVSHVVDGGSGVLTATFVGGTTITFTTVAEYADLLWTGAAWAVLELGNSAAPGTPPVLA